MGHNRGARGKSRVRLILSDDYPSTHLSGGFGDLAYRVGVGVRGGANGRSKTVEIRGWANREGAAAGEGLIVGRKSSRSVEIRGADSGGGGGGAPSAWGPRSPLCVLTAHPRIGQQDVVENGQSCDNRTSVLVSRKAMDPPKLVLIAQSADGSIVFIGGHSPRRCED